MFSCVQSRVHSTMLTHGWGPTLITHNSLCSTMLFVLYCTGQYCLYCTVLYCTVKHCLYCTVLYCIVQNKTIEYCLVLYCTIPKSHCNHPQFSVVNLLATPGLAGTGHSVQSAKYTLHFIFYSIHYILYIVQQYSVQYRIYSV